MKKLFLMALLLLQSAASGAESVKEVPAAPPASRLDHAQIRSVIAAFVEQQTATLPGKVLYQISEIDRRIALPECASLEAFLPAGSQMIGKISVGVRCSAPSAANRPARANNWSALVPVQIRFSIDLLTSTRQLPPGHTLQERDIVSQTMESSQPGGFTDPRQVIGKVLRNGVAAGQVLREDMLRPPHIVTQGQVVPLFVQGSGFSIRSEGVALNNAGEGQAVQVRVGAGRVISGMARAGGLEEIAP